MDGADPRADSAHERRHVSHSFLGAVLAGADDAGHLGVAGVEHKLEVRLADLVDEAGGFALVFYYGFRVAFPIEVDADARSFATAIAPGGDIAVPDLLAVAGGISVADRINADAVGSDIKTEFQIPLEGLAVLPRGLVAGSERYAPEIGAVIR